MKLLFLDLETTGLPRCRAANFINLGAYSTCRIVQVGTVTYRNTEEERKYTGIVRPDGFVIPYEAATVHGISH